MTKMEFIPVNLQPFVKLKVTGHICEGLNFTINTYSVVPTDENGKIPRKYSKMVLDDNTYVRYPDLIKLIPRGLSVAFLNEKEVCRLDGLEKFDGSCPLDDDENFSSNIFKQNAIDIANWKNLKVEFLEKANGKMAIFKIFTVNGKYYILGGSKNVHVIIGIDQEITDPVLHYQILKQFQNDIKDIKDKKDKNLIELVDKTIIGEYVDSQHIIFVEKPYLVYFSGPLTNIKKILPDQNTIPTSEQLQQIRYLENTEGTVIVYTNLDTGIVFRQKHKSIWYILIRVMREGLRHFTKEVKTEIIISKVFGIFKKRSNDFLALTDEDFAKWYVLLKNFVLFIKQSKYDFPDIDFTKIGMATIFHEFSNTDPVTIIENQPQIQLPTTYEEPLETPILADYVKTLYDNGMKVCVIMRGPTGSGKSYSVNRLKTVIDTDRDGIHCFSTDDLFMVNGEYKFDANKLDTLHNQNFQNFKNAVVNNTKAICVDNTNILHHDYAKYIDLARNNGYVTVILQCKKLSPEVLMARSSHNVPINSIIARCKKYVFVDPQYSGIFFSEDTIGGLLNECEIGYEPIQKTPLHVTLFFGRDQINSPTCKSIPIGKQFTVNVVSFCTSKAGKFFKVLIDGFEDRTNLHITLETNEGYKPVEVGRMPSEISFNINKEISGIFGPIY